MTKLDDRDRKLRSRLSSKGWKVLAALQKARHQSPETLVVAVWDRDGEDEPLRDRELILGALRAQGASGAADRAAAYRRLAEAIELETLVRSCPRGFEAFRDALRELIAPLLRDVQS
jgi:hypothetical protein